MTEELLGKLVGGWQLSSFAGAGKSALVFKASRGRDVAAVKIFDPELIERFGKPTQLARIGRELQLKGKYHPNLIRILDGGECPATGYLFIVMEYVDSTNLGKLLKVIPRTQVWPIISQLAKAAQFLENLNLAHRDIKPENISVDPTFQNVKLLDLGVLRPFGDPNLTDEEARIFIGTLRYSSPEYLRRQEEDSLDGWRAITFYQIGAVLHDMIMREPLFTDFSEPFAVLVEAVKTERPRIEAPDLPPDLIVLAGNCLVKSPLVRLGLVSWSRFEPPTAGLSSTEAARERVRQRHIQAKAEDGDSTPLSENRGRATKRLLSDVRSQLDSMLRLECTGNQDFPRFDISEPATTATDETHLRITFQKSSEHAIAGDLSIYLRIRIIDLDSNAVGLDCAAALSNETLTDDAFNLSLKNTVFGGVFEASAVRGHLSDYLYLTLDAGQLTTCQEVDANRTVWLTSDDHHETGPAGDAIDV